jgi:hypothetical protein
MWKAPADLPAFDDVNDDGERADLISIFQKHAQMLWAWSWIKPDDLRTDSPNAWKEATLDLFQNSDSSSLIKLANLQIDKLERRTGRSPATVEETLRRSSIHRAAKMALMVRELLSHWYPNENKDDINDCANEIVAALWKKSVRALAIAEAVEDGAVDANADGWKVTADRAGALPQPRP